MAAVYRRVILKVSGESLADGKAPVSPEAARRVAGEVAQASALGCEIGLVVGGGNILRGAAVEGPGVDRVVADHMGMLATVVNSLALCTAFESLGRASAVMSAVPCGGIAAFYDHRKARDLLSGGTVVVLAAGTGNPFFSTDTAAALRAAELGADALLKATKVDGVYDADPMKDPAARKFEKLSYSDFLERGLRVMDLTAVALCREQRMPIVVFSLSTPGNVARVVGGEDVGTRVMEG